MWWYFVVSRKNAKLFYPKAKPIQAIFFHNNMTMRLWAEQWLTELGGLSYIGVLHFYMFYHKPSLSQFFLPKKTWEKCMQAKRPVFGKTAKASMHVPFYRKLQPLRILIQSILPAVLLSDPIIPRLKHDLIIHMFLCFANDWQKGSRFC